MPSSPENPRRLLLVIQGFTAYGGAEHQLEHLARGLGRLGHDVTICSIDPVTRDVRSLEAEGVKVRTLGTEGRLQRFAAILPLVRLARKADVVHCTMWDASLWGRIAGVLARRPVIVADHATDRSVQVSADGSPRGSWIATHNRLLDRFTFATVTCATSQAALLTSEGVAPDKIVHIPNGVPIAEIEVARDEDPTRRQLGVPATAKLVLHVAVFRPEKNQAGTLEALARWRRRDGDFHLVFAGDGPTRSAVERRADDLDADWVHFLGFRDDVPALLRLADIMVLPSLSDAMPMTVLEAMAVGVPVIASDVGDVRRTLAGGGICVPAGDSRAFELACERVLADEALRAEMGRIARQNARQFDSRVMAARYSELFQRAS